MGTTIEEIAGELIENGVDLIDANASFIEMNNAKDLYSVCYAILEGQGDLDEFQQIELAEKVMNIIDELASKEINLDNCMNIGQLPKKRGRKKISDNRVMRIARLIKDKDYSRNKAYKEVAKELNLSPTTLRTQYLAAEKKSINKLP